MVIEYHVPFVSFSRFGWQPTLMRLDEKDSACSRRKIGSRCHFSGLVGGWATPLKNMSSSVGMMKFPIYGKKMFQTTNQKGKAFENPEKTPWISWWKPHEQRAKNSGHDFTPTVYGTSTEQNWDLMCPKGCLIYPLNHRIGWWENLQESPIFDGKNHGFL